MTSPTTPAVRPIPQSHALGWLLIVVGGVGVAAAVGFYPTSTSGMFAGYDALGIAVVVGFAATALRVDLPRGPALAVLGLCGIGLLVLGFFKDASTFVEVADVTAGALIILGTVLQSTPDA